jgi:hypothetical protein
VIGGGDVASPAHFAPTAILASPTPPAVLLELRRSLEAAHEELARAVAQRERARLQVGVPRLSLAVIGCCDFSSTRPRLIHPQTS